MKHLFILLFFSLHLLAITANNKLTCHISNLGDRPVYLSLIQGEKDEILDSTLARNGEFFFILDSAYPVGMYKIILHRVTRPRFEETSIELVYNKEDIEIRSGYKYPLDSIRILQSTENKAYYDFRKKERTFQIRFDLLMQMIKQFPPEDPFYGDIVNRFNALQYEREALITFSVNQYKNLLCSAIIQMQHFPVLDLRWPLQDKISHQRLHYFDSLPFTDERLTNSNIYTSKIMSYITLYHNPGLPLTAQQNELITAAKIIMQHTDKNQKVYDQVVTYMLSVFERFGFDDVLLFVAQNYKKASCNLDNNASLSERLDGYIRMSVGMTAPEVSIPDINGTTIQFGNIGKNYVLVIFWESNCPHCAEALPVLKTFYESVNRKNFEVVAISADKSVDSWKKTIERTQYPWINCAEGKGWDGKSLLDFNIYSTPSYFIIDKNRKIIAKPNNMSEVLDTLRTLIK